ncbi:MAG: branched-chain amino acid ABC transporter permease, partial [Candidatus Heimdallarchaeota archaeon]|nr:branched-chain amino acid ABC transporter permease [Candidatus Heimdallarchaeota archaeon]
AMRAVSQDPEAAALVGINVRKIYFIANGLAMGLVASAAVLTTPYEAQPGWNPGMGWAPLIFSITVVTLGGLGSIKGSFYAGLLLGFAESIVGILNPELGTVIPLLVILAVLIIKPEGLFGKEEDEE